LTNRHLVRPWLEEPRDRGLIAKGWKPRLFRLIVFFPSLRRPITLEPARFSREVDLALCRVRGEDARSLPPPLPLAEDAVPVSLGQTVGAVGFPAGEEGLLARLDPRVLQRLARGKRSPEEILRRVSQLGLVKPLATQGHIGDLSEQQIVYDAATTFGGSGSVLVDAEGRVIGVAFALMTEFIGSNFAVPVRYARELLRKESGAAGAEDNSRELAARRR
ncbi:MAG TPA: trypsin-like peptidase domain-containing protein, partial [Thermoanaerobaculia bacterium]|nr:trypsin-like peptidase domain-containing protein [Thermoanaerobaculia bacterium]